MFPFMRDHAILNRNQALRLLKTYNDIHLPRKFKAILDKYEHDPESLRAAGLASSVDHCETWQPDMLVHLYTIDEMLTIKPSIKQPMPCLTMVLG